MLKRRPLPGPLAVLFVRPAFAQALTPSGLIKMVVAYPAGGPTDVIARIVAADIATALGQQVSGREPVGRRRRGRHAGRGQGQARRSVTITFGNNQTHGNNMFMLKEPGYDAVKDFAPLAGAGAFEHVRGAQRPAGAEHPGRDQARQGKARRAELRLDRHRLGLAPLDRAVHGAHRHQDDPHPLSRRAAPGAGPRGRPHRHLQLDPAQRAGPDQRGPNPRRRHRQHQAQCQAAQRADPRGAGCHGRQRLVLGGLLRPGRDAAADPRPAVGRDPDGLAPGGASTRPPPPPRPPPLPTRKRPTRRK